MNILLLASHAVAEFDDIRMFTDMGHDVFCPGGYQDPTQPGEAIRPGIPNAPVHPDLIEACELVRHTQGDPGPRIDWAKAHVASDVLDWADVIIVHHFPEVWIAQQWPRIRHKRVVWRTCGQSNPHLEQAMARYRRDGLQIVRYSPAERRFFEPRKAWAGEDALIRFGKYPDDYGPWTGENVHVANLTQDLAARGDACGYGFWLEATAGLPTMPAGKGSEALRGYGILSYRHMLHYLSASRVYLYTGTRPASYTLGLIEAMLSGVPVVSIDAGSWGAGWGGSELFEAHEIVSGYPADWARAVLSDYLGDHDKAREHGAWGRQRAIDLFGIDQISARWQAFLDGREAEPQPAMSYLDTLPEVA
jgi:glycosyltransferase involved in cell wall biosynthesis